MRKFNLDGVEKGAKGLEEVLKKPLESAEDITHQVDKICRAAGIKESPPKKQTRRRPKVVA